MLAPARPVVVLGFDAMDPGIARQMAEDGRLPHFASFFAEAAYSTVTNPPGLVVGSTWPSFWTGLWPSRHGFYCYRQLEPHSYKVRRYTPLDIAAPPFWMALADAGRRVCIVDVPLVPLTRPRDGIHAIDWGTHDRMLSFDAWPAEVRTEIAEQAAPYPIQGKCDDYAMRGAWDELYETLCVGIERKTDLNLRLLAGGEWDLFASVYCESHCAGHQFWWAHDPEHPRYIPEAGDPLLRVYQALDRALGRMLERAPAGANVVLLLSHGIGNHNGADHLLREILIRLDDAYAPRSRAVVLRERIYRLLRRTWERQRHRQRERQLDPRWLDASRRFIRLPNNELYGGVRLNLQGREPRGQLRPADAEAATAWLERELRALVHPDTGVSVVRRVMRTHQLYSGALRDGLPDLMVDWDRSAPINAVTSPSIGTVRGDYDGPRTGDHRPTGMVFVRGAGIPPGRVPHDVKMVDLAPTVLAMAGGPPGDFDGVVIPTLPLAAG